MCNDESERASAFVEAEALKTLSTAASHVGLRFDEQLVAFEETGWLEAASREQQ